MDASVAELDWMADHNFVGVYGPGYLKHAALPPLSDRYWDRYWATCVERNITIVVHAGYGTEFGKAFPSSRRSTTTWWRRRALNLDEMIPHADAITDQSVQFFNEFLNKNLDSRRPMWQMMLGGVFDRHPDLKLMHEYDPAA